MGCSVCEHPNAFGVMKRVFSGELTYVQAAKELNRPTEEVWTCFREHWQMESSDGVVTLRALKEAESVEDYVALLKKTLRKFITRLSEALSLPISAYNETAITKLSTEQRSLMRDILEFEGKLRSTPVIQLNILQIQMSKLTSFLFSELCEADQQKLLRALPELQQR